MSSKTVISAQAIFVKELAERLQKDIESNLDKPSVYASVYSGMANYTQIQSDIKRLRRELLELSNMIGYQYGR